jgi:hypothetical protein
VQGVQAGEPRADHDDIQRLLAGVHKQSP